MRKSVIVHATYSGRIRARRFIRNTAGEIVVVPAVVLFVDDK
jgi:hypothetical protein